MYVENACPPSLEPPNEFMPPRGRVVRTALARNLLTSLMVFGPGLIVMEADDDAGALSSYIQAGAQ